MKKVLPIFFLSALFAALLAPTTASIVLAAACSTNCQSIVQQPSCECGTAVLSPAPAGTQVCGISAIDGRIRSFNSTQDCLAAVAGTGTSVPGGAPTVVSSAQDLINLVERIGNWVFVALMSVAGMFLIIAGFMYVTAGGSPEKAGKGRQMLINALIGVVIGLLARGIVQVIKSIIST